jgi:hypothetical protein
LRTQEINRVHKVLETANRKLGAVASNVVGVSGRRMLRAVEAGESDPQVLAEPAEPAKGRLREKLPALRLALAGRVQAHHRQLIGELLDHIAYLEQTMNRPSSGWRRGSLTSSTSRTPRCSYCSPCPPPNRSLRR